MRESLSMVSIVIPTFNRRGLLRTTLEALARQTYPADQFEALVVSDGSSDGTDSMTESYAREAPYRLRLITQGNAGPSRARNRGVQEAIGDVVLFLDDDIESCPDLVGAHAGHHAGAEDVAVLGHIAP